MARLLINGIESTLSQQEFSSFHGHSVFTTLRSQNSLPHRWELHWQRLVKHAQFFDFVIPKEDLLLKLISEELAPTKQLQKIRIIISGKKFALSFEDLLLQSPDIYQGVSIMKSSWQVHPQLYSYKTGNYLAYALALKQAQTAGVFEGLLLNHDNYVVDGARTSIIYYDGITLCAVAGGLDGCERQAVLEYACNIGLEVSSKYLRFEELNGQILLANSLMGLVPVNQVNEQWLIDLIDRFRPHQDQKSLDLDDE